MNEEELKAKLAAAEAREEALHQTNERLALTLVDAEEAKEAALLQPEPATDPWRGEALPCGPNCPKSKPCDEIYRDKDVPDHCERCHHLMACHVYEPAGGEG